MVISRVDRVGVDRSGLLDTRFQSAVSKEHLNVCLVCVCALTVVEYHLTQVQSVTENILEKPTLHLRL